MDGASRWWPGAPPEWALTVVDTRDDATHRAPDVPAFDAASDDAVLVEACRAGSREAFDLIVERHRRAVYNVCIRFAGSHEDASDLAQDVFVRAYRGLERFRGDAALSTWLYRIAVNVCLNHAAAAKAPVDPLDGRDVVDRREEPPDRRVLREERAARVRDAIRQLPAKQRLTVILRTYHDLTHEQIASMVGSSVGTVKANFFHALRNLRSRLDKETAS